jgi:hypothetical protein
MKAEATPLIHSYGTGAVQDKSLAETVAELRFQVESLQKRAGSEPGADTSPPVLFDVGFVKNCYSYAMGHLLQPGAGAHRLPPVPTSLSIIFTLTSLCVFQLVFAFAFMDTAGLGWWTNHYSAYSDPIHVANYYATRPAGVVFGDSGMYYPTVNVVCAVLAVLYLCFSLKVDNRSTLLAVFPLEHIFFHVPARGEDCSAGGFAVQLSLSLWMLLMWMIRALFIPVIVAYGSVLLYTQSASAVDIVLNSVAIGFILDMDDFFYGQFCGTDAHRSKYEDSPGSAAATGRTRTNVDFSLWMIYIVDAGNLILIGLRSYGLVMKGEFMKSYLSPEGDSMTGGVLIYFYLRAAAFALSYVWFCLCNDHIHPESIGGMIFGMMKSKVLSTPIYLVAFALTTVGLARLAHEVNHLMNGMIGYGPASLISRSLNMQLCLNGLGTNYTCMNTIVPH